MSGLRLLMLLVILLAATSATPQNPRFRDADQFGFEDLSGGESSSAYTPLSSAAIAELPQPSAKGVDWKPLLIDSLRFIAVEHAFRFLTEPSTRRQLAHEPFFGGYINSLASLHGWSDGDPFYVNYVGHPMQGAVSGYIWQHNDRAYRDVEFGKNRRYWKSKLRSLAFSYVYSVQFEIGPFSEASIGHIQHEYPQVGFVDHVITPTIGTGWAIGEDYLDRQVIQRAEMKFSNRWIRLLLRSGLNPSRSFANAMSLNVPWHRDDRPGLFRSRETLSLRPPVAAQTAKQTAPSKGNAPFEFGVTASHRQFLYSSQSAGCIGGAGTAAFRIDSQMQIVAEVGGCKLTGVDYPHSGDMLEYSVGPRWTPAFANKWRPHAQLLIGGVHVTQELVDEQKKAELQPIYQAKHTAPPHELYAKYWEGSSFSIKVGAGVNYNINSALSVNIVDVNYARNSLGPINGIDYRNGLQWAGGLVLRMGTW